MAKTITTITTPSTPMPRPTNRPPWDFGACGGRGMVPDRLRAPGRDRRGEEPARSWVPEAERVGAAGIGALTVFVRMLVLPVGTRRFWPQSGHSTEDPGSTSVTSIVEWQDPHCRIFAMASSSPRLTMIRRLL